MKKNFILVVILLLCVTLVGCGKKDPINKLKDNTNIKETTKVSNISESYTKYQDLKMAAYDKLSEKIPEDDFTLTFSLLGFISGDLMIVPVTICGLSETEAAYSFALFNITDYKNDGDKCTISYNVDDEKSRFETIYDEKTDSIQIKMYENNVLKIIYEYTKLDEGYATLQYYYDDENNITSYRSIFNKDYIAVGFFEDIKTTPDSIYKSKINNNEWTKGGKYWTEYDNGKFDSTFEQY